MGMRQDGTVLQNIFPVPRDFEKSGKTADFCPKSPGGGPGQSPILEKSNMFLKSSERSKCGDQCAKEKDKVMIMLQFEIKCIFKFGGYSEN